LTLSQALATNIFEDAEAGRKPIAEVRGQIAEVKNQFRSRKLPVLKTENWELGTENWLFTSAI